MPGAGERAPRIRQRGISGGQGALKAACEGCWKTFDLTGYCRVDFRVTPEGEPTVLEINTNPGISPDAGLPAAALEAGMNYDQFLSRLVEIAHYRAP